MLVRGFVRICIVGYSACVRIIALLLLCFSICARMLTSKGTDILLLYNTNDIKK